MLLGYNTWSMPMVDIDRSVAHLAKLGFDSLELTICKGWPTEATGLDPAERRRIRALIDDHGLVLSGCSGNTPVSVDEPEWAGNSGRIVAYLDFLAEIQKPGERLYLATTSGLPPGMDPPTAWHERRALLVERFGRLAAHAHARGVTLHLEPHVLTAVQRPEHVLWLLGQVDSPALRISLDISHFEVQGDDYHDIVRTLAPVTGAVEVKDERGLYPDFKFLTPGEGEMDYPGFLRALAEAGYDGSVSVEISLMRQAVAGYDPLAAATASYEVLSQAFTSAGIARGARLS